MFGLDILVTLRTAYPHEDVRLLVRLGLFTL